MANLTVKIYDHIKQGGKWTYLPVDVSLDTRSTKTIAGNFKITWYQGGAKKFSAGHFPFLADAIRAGQEKRLALRDAMDGVAAAPTEPGRVRIDVAADTYLRRMELKKKRPGTIALATHDLHEWQKWNDAHSKRVFVDQITNDDMLEYRNWVVTSGREAQTAVNKTMRVNHFVTQTLKLQPGKGPITQVEAENIIVKSAANDVEYFTQEELDKFFAHCDSRQHLIFSTFLHSGCRREEIEYLYWSDIDFTNGTLGVHAKVEFDFTIKTKEERTVPLPMDLIARLKAWKETSTSRLVFPTAMGNPLGNSLLVAVKRVARRAGLNCGTCKTCLKSGQCSHFYLHKFRSTFATRMLQEGLDIASLQELLGHTTLEATMRYLGNLKSKALRTKVDQIWARTAPLAEAVLVTDAVQ